MIQLSYAVFVTFKRRKAKQKQGNGETLSRIRKKKTKEALRKMMMKKSLFLFSLLLFIVLPFSHQARILKNPNGKPPLSQAHTELINYGFPIGLLPASVQKYTLNQTSGAFAVDLGGTCKITLPPDNYLATYSKQITGKIDQGKIAELDGIRVRALFKWWSITGIRSSGDNLVFEVGMVTAKYPAKNFDESLFCEGQHSSS